MQSQRAVVKNAALRDILLRVEGCRERLNGSNPAGEISVLRQIEKDLENTMIRAGDSDREQAAVLLMVWSVLSLAYKKESEYRSCLECLLKVRKLEVALEASQLDTAITHANLGTCYHFLQETDMGLKHTTIAKDTLVQQVKLSQQDVHTYPPGYKKKLMLNLVLVYFNRGVQYFRLGDMQKFKLNVTQSLELATQKFGKEESITTLIYSLQAKEDKSALKPFFISKIPDIAAYLATQERRRISLRDIDIRPARHQRQADIDREEERQKNRTDLDSLVRPTSSEKLPLLNSRELSRGVSRGAEEKSRVYSVGPKAARSRATYSEAPDRRLRSEDDSEPRASPKQKLAPLNQHASPHDRSASLHGRKAPRATGSTADASAFGEKLDKPQSSASNPANYTLSRISVALKYMK